MKLDDVNNFMLGNEQVDKIYLGNTEVWSSASTPPVAPNNFELEVEYSKVNTTYNLVFTWDPVPDSSYSLYYTISGTPKTVTISAGTTTYSIGGVRGSSMAVLSTVVAVKGGLSGDESAQSASIRAKASKPGKPTSSSTGQCKACAYPCDCTSSTSFIDYIKGTATKGTNADYVKITSGSQSSTGSTTANVTVKPSCIVISTVSFTAYSYNDGTPSDALTFTGRKNCLVIDR